MVGEDEPPGVEVFEVAAVAEPVPVQPRPRESGQDDLDGSVEVVREEPERCDCNVLNVTFRDGDDDGFAILSDDYPRWRGQPDCKVS
jgi:hypothetical protein